MVFPICFILFAVLAALIRRIHADKIEYMRQCCDLVDDDEGSLDHIGPFMQCVNTSTTLQEQNVLSDMGSGKFGPSLGLGIVTFASSNIWEYSAYSLAVNGLYAELNGYAMKHFDPSMTNPEPLDSRWSKIALLIDALEDSTAWGRSMDYVVWFDADLIVLDLQLRLESVAAASPQAHILASAEHAGSSTMINSGAILVRNTAWARQFLRKWWGTAAERRLYSDQEKFDQVYISLTAKERDKVQILPPDAINSDPPAMTMLERHNQVLHLMGEHTQFRKEVFQNAFREACTLPFSGDLAQVRHQLGVSREGLLELTLSAYGRETNERLASFELLAATGEGSLGEARALSNSVHHYAHALESTGDMGEPMTQGSRASAMRRRNYELLLENINNMRPTNAAYENANGIAMEDWPELLKKCAEAGQQVTLKSDLPVEYRSTVASNVLLILDEILAKCHSLQRPAVLQMVASLHGERGHLARESNRPFDALSSYEQYLSIARQLSPQVGAHVTIEPLSLVANMLASAGRLAEAYPMYDEVIALNAKRVGRAHHSNAFHLINAGTAKSEGGYYVEAAELLQEGVAILRAHAAPSDHIHLKNALRQLKGLEKFLR